MLKFIFIACVLITNSLFGQAPSIVLNSSGTLSVNDSVFENGLVNVNRFSKIINEDYKIERLKKPNIRFFKYTFKKSNISLTSIDDKHDYEMCWLLHVNFRKRRHQYFKGDFVLLDKRLDWNTSFDDIYNDPDLEELIDKTIYQDQLRPSKYFMMVNVDRFSLSILFEKRKGVYKLKSIEMKVATKRD